MSDEHIDRVKRPRSKDISTWFSRKSAQPSSCASSQASVSTPIAVAATEEPSSESPLLGSQRNEFDPHGNVNAIERDPGKRCPLWKYPVNQREAIRKAYVALGPCQPRLKNYPLSIHRSQNRKFNFDWFEGHPWLEYSEDQDKIYCFPCFLFDKKNTSNHVFTVDGVRNWKSKNVLTVHIGGIESPHNEAMEKWNLLRNLATQIESVFVKRTTKEVEHNRFRLKAAIEAARLLANQGQAFRGHDESESSLNAGNFRQVRKSFERMASDDDRVILENAPGNAKYTSPPVQKELLNILGNRVRQMIREEVGDAKFCILVDEAVDLLVELTSTLDLHDKFSLFETQKVLLLAKSFYPQDFLQDDLLTLELECAYYKKYMTQDVAFHTLDSMSDLCRKLVQRRKSDFYPMIYRLLCLVLTLPVSTATTERAFSSMNIIKNKLRNKIEDDFLDDCMVLHIEKEFAEAVDNEAVINDFEALGPRRVKFS